MSLQPKLTFSEKNGQFKLIQDSNSKRVNDLQMRSKIQVIRYNKVDPASLSDNNSFERFRKGIEF